MSGLQAAKRATARPNDSKKPKSILKEGQGRRPEGFSPEGRAPVPTVNSHSIPVGWGARLQRPGGAGASRSAGGRRRGAANRARQREEGGCVRGWWLRAVGSACGGVCFSVYISRHGNTPSLQVGIKIAAIFADGGYRSNNLNLCS